MVTGDLYVSVQTEQHTRVRVRRRSCTEDPPTTPQTMFRSAEAWRVHTFNFLMVLQHCAACPCRWDSLAPGPFALASDNWAF